MELSVIICTHNPRTDYLRRVLEALRAQTLSHSAWELLMIDNASDKLLAPHFDLSWHPQARHIREERLGLTPARLRGIEESRGELLVFVDDDNVLYPDYLEVALSLGRKWPILGAWGGQTIPEFEQTPPDWTKAYWGLLAIRQFEADRWSNLPYLYETAPCGAGLCVRKTVAQKYWNEIQPQPFRLELGRKGNLLTGGEDWDLAFTSCDIGLGTGIFTDLKLTHLMPIFRFQEEYLLRLIEASSYSGTIFDVVRERPSIKISWRAELLRRIRPWLMSPKNRRFYNASQRGISKARKELKTNPTTGQQQVIKTV